MRPVFNLSVIALTCLLSSQAFAGCLTSPVPSNLITSNFGLRLHPVYKTWKPHRGTDFRAYMKTPVSAAAGGVVSYVGPIGGGGNTVMVLSPDGVLSKYMHLSVFKVQRGDSVSQGQLIALSGNTGHASASPHLHLETSINNGTQAVDARSLMCSALAEKGGAGPDKAMGPMANNNPMPTAPVGGGGGQVFSSADPQGAELMMPFDGYEGMSESEIMRAEAERRVFEPQWYEKMTIATPGSVQKELLMIQSMKVWMAEREREIMENIESLVAANSAIKSRKHAAEERQRLAAVAAKNAAK